MQHHHTPKTMNLFFPHIPYSRLADLVEGRLPPDERAHLEEHIATCARCSGEVAHLERLIGLMRTDTSEDAPPAVIARAERLFHSRTVSSSDSSNLRHHVLAVRRFDSLGLAPAFGVRSGEPSARQLLFSARAHDIDLRIEPAGQAWTVSGQVLGESAAGGQAELQGATSTTQVALNEQSEFTLPPVSAGHYRLVLRLANVDVEVDELKIGT
jgi:anti-sigma factor RsiW